jgi:hypothetical protein
MIRRSRPYTAGPGSAVETCSSSKFESRNKVDAKKRREGEGWQSGRQRGIWCSFQPGSVIILCPWDCKMPPLQGSRAHNLVGKGRILAGTAQWTFSADSLHVICAGRGREWYHESDSFVFSVRSDLLCIQPHHHETPSRWRVPLSRRRQVMELIPLKYPIRWQPTHFCRRTKTSSSINEDQRSGGKLWIGTGLSGQATLKGGLR